MKKNYLVCNSYFSTVSLKVKRLVMKGGPESQNNTQEALKRKESKNETLLKNPTTADLDKNSEIAQKAGLSKIDNHQAAADKKEEQERLAARSRGMVMGAIDQAMNDFPGKTREELIKFGEGVIAKLALNKNFPGFQYLKGETIRSVYDAPDSSDNFEEQKAQLKAMMPNMMPKDKEQKLLEISLIGHKTLGIIIDDKGNYKIDTVQKLQYSED